MLHCDRRFRLGHGLALLACLMLVAVVVAGCKPAETPTPAPDKPVVTPETAPVTPPPAPTPAPPAPEVTAPAAPVAPTAAPAAPVAPPMPAPGTGQGSVK